MSSIKESNTKKAIQHYGKESLHVKTDITSEESEKLKINYLNKNIHISEADIIKTEKQTKLQLCSEIWKDERKKRITASNFGSVVKRNSKTEIAPLIKQLLYSTFKGNKTTRIGIKEEKVTITQYYTEVPYLGSTSSQQTSGKVKTRRRKTLIVESDTEINEAVVKTTSKVAKRSKRYCSGPKFVGREI
ncbi:unnamed protein product [Mytilus coruscus]|uniref:Uncharacterized protein n=1 Tax=Mytilus coruscus TaxID=42192 RepID=A0A6J8AMI3_MYTCO|nr:unnamed protein product [Mytilus coruscus]